MRSPSRWIWRSTRVVALSSVANASCGPPSPPPKSPATDRQLAVGVGGCFETQYRTKVHSQQLNKVVIWVDRFGRFAANFKVSPDFRRGPVGIDEHLRYP